MTDHEPLSDADYEAMADDYEAHPPRADEIVSAEIDPAVLRMGRPLAGETRGKTPALSVRLPVDVRNLLRQRALADEATESELIRRAVVEYIKNHPVSK